MNMTGVSGHKFKHRFSEKKMQVKSLRSNRAFSLIELVVVVVILGIIGAIAIPRMSRGAAGAADSALVADLAVLRNAIALYETEHQGTYPTLAAFSTQLTQYTDIASATSATKTGAYIYGPYLRAVPKLKVGSNKGSAALVATQSGTAGWVYVETTGVISANLPGTETDASGTAYASY
jgi:general secretion pathway protein G